MINGMTSITHGDVLVNGVSVRDSLSSVRHEMGCCPQHDTLWPELSAHQHLKFFGIFQGMHDIDGAIADMLKAVRLDREGWNSR
jgi:ABC-type multidrug transport system ATPase subunit